MRAKRLFVDVEMNLPLARSRSRVAAPRSDIVEAGSERHVGQPWVMSR
jgi:hypothetical protein